MTEESSISSSTSSTSTPLHSNSESKDFSAEYGLLDFFSGLNNLDSDNFDTNFSIEMPLDLAQLIRDTEAGILPTQPLTDHQVGYFRMWCQKKVELLLPEQVREAADVRRFQDLVAKLAEKRNNNSNA